MNNKEFIGKCTMCGAEDVKVTIIDANRETGKISLGYRRDEDNPWTIAKSKYAVNDVATVKVVRLTAFGAFVELLPGIDGLVHISQIANKRIEHPSNEHSPIEHGEFLNSTVFKC
jgi:4-hydroxy-3-methylbut-2-enyl diphosphate reductase